MEQFPLLNEKLDAGKNRRPEFGPIWLDLPSRTLCAAGVEHRENLARQEYQILWLLVRAQGNTITTDEIMQFVREDELDDKEYSLVDNTVAVYMLKLRKKLERLVPGKISIENLELRGYRLVLH